MKRLFLLLFILHGLVAYGQTLTPTLLALDTTIYATPAFNNFVAGYLPGYRLLGADKQQPQDVKYVFVHDDDEVRLEYHYATESIADSLPPQKVVIFQSIRGPVDALVRIYNGLFHTQLTTAIDQVQQMGGTITYHNKTYICNIAADDFKPDYWVLSFVRSM